MPRIFDGHNDALSRILEAGPAAPDGFLAGEGREEIPTVADP